MCNPARDAAMDANLPIALPTPPARPVGADEYRSAGRHPAVAEARRLFGRTLAAWACDLLLLRRAGLERPAWTDLEEPGWSEAA